MSNAGIHQDPEIKVKYDKLREKTTWIKIKKKQPNNKEWVLVVGKDFYSLAQYRMKKFVEFESDLLLKDVTQWLRLPEPPRD